MRGLSGPEHQMEGVPEEPPQPLEHQMVLEETATPTKKKLKNGKKERTQIPKKLLERGAESSGGCAHQCTAIILPDKVHVLSSCKTTAVRAGYDANTAIFLLLSLSPPQTHTLSF